MEEKDLWENRPEFHWKRVKEDRQQLVLYKNEKEITYGLWRSSKTFKDWLLLL